MFVGQLLHYYYYYYYYYDNSHVCRKKALKAQEGEYKCYISSFVRMSKLPALQFNKTNTEHCSALRLMLISPQRSYQPNSFPFNENAFMAV